jgi:TrkA-N domain/RyR domain
MARGTARYRRLRALWRQYRWALTGVMVLAVLILGVIGFAQQERRSAAGAALPILDRLYNTLALFSFNQNLHPPLPPLLEIARWLAPLAVAYAGFRILAAILAEHWVRLRVRVLFRRHVIVFGLGRCGMRLAITFREHGDRVVAVDKGPSATEATECGDRGIPLVRGDATDPAVLARAGLRRCRLVIVVCGDEGTNAEAALVITRLSGGRRPVLRVLVHIGDTDLCQLLEHAALTTLGRDRVRLEFFNVYRLGPSALLDAWQPLRATAGSGPPQLIVAGSGPMAVNLITEAARRWRLDHRDSPERMRVTLIAPDAAAQAAVLGARLPALGGSACLTAVDADPAAAPFALPMPSATDGGPGIGHPDIAFACLESDTDNIQAAIRLRHALPEEIPVVACATSLASASLIRLLDHSVGGYLTNAHMFGLLEGICRPEVVLNLESEAFARAAHRDYVRRSLAGGASPGTDPALAPWEDLPERLRESNRAQVADIPAKLDAIGYEFVPTDDWDAAPLSLTDAQVETLARIEHERWMKERLEAGFRYGPVRDARNKVSPYLVPWEELAADVRDLDRDAVRLIPAILAAAGYAIVPRPKRAAKSPALSTPAGIADPVANDARP